MKTKSFLLALVLLLLHMSVRAETTAIVATPLTTCSWIGAETTIYFSTCINRNFKLISRATGLDLRNCVNFSHQLDYAFQICVRKNFRHISDRLKLNLNTCNTLGTDVNVLYIGCVQKSFKQIERVMK